MSDSANDQLVSFAYVIGLTMDRIPDYVPSDKTMTMLVRLWIASGLDSYVQHRSEEGN